MQQGFFDALLARSAELEHTVPPIATQRRASAAEAVRLGIPGRLETWKYTPIQGFYAEPFASSVASPTAALERATPSFIAFAGALPLTLHGARPQLPSDAAGARIELSSMAKSAAMEPINASIDVARHPLCHVNTALLSDGLRVRIPAGVDAGALDLRFASGDALSNISRVSVELGAGSRLRLIEQRCEDRPTNSVVEVVLHPRAELEHVRVLPPTDARCWYLVSVSVAASAGYRLRGYATGSQLRRSDIHVRLLGSHANADIQLACATHEKTRLDHQVVVEHAATDTLSRQAIRSIATGASELTCNGRIHIHPGAQRSDARLTNRNLLLSRKARINTKPELEIYANDVKCSHGATIAQLDPAQLFYLRSRGIDDPAARAMLLAAFLDVGLQDWERDAGVAALFAGALAA